MAVLIDTSLWVHQLRGSGDARQRARVEALLLQGEAAWCPVVRLELWRGIGNAAERRTLERYRQVLPDYAITDMVWARAIALADRARRNGATVPLPDLLIFACAREHRLGLAHDDAHFEQLARLEPVA